MPFEWILFYPLIKEWVSILVSHFGCWIWTWRQDPWARLQSLVKSFPRTFFPLSVKWGWVKDLQGPSSVSILGSQRVHVWIFCLILEHLEYVLLLALVSSACTSVSHDELLQVYSWLILFPLQLPLVFFVQRLSCILSLCSALNSFWAPVPP